MPPSTETIVAQQIRSEIKKTSLNAVALRLGVNRHSVATFLLGSARPGTVALVVQLHAAQVKP